MGVPHAIASIITKPKGSGQAIGKSRAAASPRNRDLSKPPISLMNSMSGCLSKGLICGFEIGGAQRNQFSPQSLNVDQRRQPSGSPDPIPSREKCGPGKLRSLLCLHREKESRAANRDAR